MAPPKRRGRAPPRARRKSQSVVSNQLAGLSLAPRTPQVHKFRRVFQEVISGAVSGIVAYTPVVALNKMPSFLEIFNLFTEYRFTHVTVLFRPIQSTFSLIGPAVFPVVNTVFDYTDTTSLSGTTAAQQYPSWKQNTFSQMRPNIQIGYQPRIVVGGLLSPFSTGSALMPVNSFITMANTAVEFTGLKTVIEEFSSGVQMQVTFLCDFECRGTR